MTEIPVGTPLWLQGYGYNLEYGTLEGVALRWRSDRDGDLGTGSQALVTLSPGRHVITLAATDRRTICRWSSAASEQLGLWQGVDLDTDEMWCTMWI